MAHVSEGLNNNNNDSKYKKKKMIIIINSENNTWDRMKYNIISLKIINVNSCLMFVIKITRDYHFRKINVYVPASSYNMHFNCTHRYKHEFLKFKCTYIKYNIQITNWT